MHKEYTDRQTDKHSLYLYGTQYAPKGSIRIYATRIIWITIKNVREEAIQW